MKPLFIFETPKAKSSSNILVDRINDILIPKLTAFNFRSSIVYLKEFGITPMLSVQKKSKRGNPVFVLPWIRPFSTNKNAARVLNDYPRLNVVKRLKNASNKEKIEGMFALVQKFHLYFLVLMQKTDDLYWIDKYENISLEFWKTTYRKKDLPKDRIHFPDYKDFNFVKEKEFRKLLNDITK
jgi:hypothetical protein